MAGEFFVQENMNIIISLLVTIHYKIFNSVQYYNQWENLTNFYKIAKLKVNFWVPSNH